MSSKSHRASTSSFAGSIQALFYGFDMDRMLKGLLAELLYGNIGVEIPTYVQNDNTEAAYRADSLNTVANGKRPNGFLESNRGALAKNDWLSVGYIPGALNTSGGLTKAMSSTNLRGLLTRNTFRIVTEWESMKLGKECPYLSDI